MGKDENSNEILNMFAERIEARRAHTKRLEQSVRDGSIDFRAAVAVVATRLKEIVDPAPGSIGLDFYEAMFFYDEYIPYEISDDKISSLIKNAEIDFKAYQALRLFSHLIGDKGKDLVSLKDCKSRVLLGIFKPPRRPKGLSQFRNVHRDTIIVGQIIALVDIGFNATRNKAKPGICACDVIVDALASSPVELSYDAVEGIWQRRGKLPTPKFFIEAVTQALSSLS